MSAWPGFPRCSAPITSRSPNSAPRDSTASSSRSTTAGRRSTSPTCRRSARWSSPCARPRSLIIERMSAAWVHGALDAPPAVAQFCVPLDARIAVIDRPPHRRSARSRIDDDDIVRFGEIRCTSPARTAFDLLRDPTPRRRRGRRRRRRADRRPARRSRTTLHDRLDAAVRMPHKATARRRLELRRVGSSRRAQRAIGLSRRSRGRRRRRRRCGAPRSARGRGAWCRPSRRRTG